MMIVKAIPDHDLDHLEALAVGIQKRKPTEIPKCGTYRTTLSEEGRVHVPPNP
jgi:hypothetical protein